MTETKKDWRRDSLATRIDLRMPNEVYDRVIEIATANGEKINPKTNQVRVTATLNRLIEIGIRYYLDSNREVSDNIRQTSDSIGLNEKYQELSDKYQTLEAKLSEVNPIDSGTLTHQDVLKIVSESIGNSFCLSAVPNEERVNTLVCMAIDKAFDPLANEIARVDRQVAELRNDLGDRFVSTVGSIAKTNSQKPQKEAESDPNHKTWGEFFKMLDIDALAAKDAQKVENIERRNKQVEAGIAKARELGLGTWKVDRAARSFVRVENS